MRRLAAIAAIAIFTASPAFALDEVKLSPVDLLADAPHLVGKRIATGNCIAIFASTSAVGCAAVRLTGSPGQFIFEASTMDAESKRRALQNCTGFKDIPKCRVAEVYGIVKSIQTGSPVISYASLVWEDEKDDPIGDCMAIDSTITLGGKLSLKKYALPTGPAPYGVALLLTMSPAVCIEGYPKPVKTLQVVMADDAGTKRARALVGSFATISGHVELATTQYHHMPVMLFQGTIQP